ncbi:unnamed protein product [Rhizophagus irregularis]|nr:unnamed protein product [Rhizophagus irregularis]CAB5350086.1 unnamed protein product [Rhizophagus irregularis]
MIFGTVERRKIDGTNHIISHLISVIPLDCKSLLENIISPKITCVGDIPRALHNPRGYRPLFLQTVLWGVVPEQQNSRNSVTSGCNSAMNIAN